MANGITGLLGQDPEQLASLQGVAPTAAGNPFANVPMQDPVAPPQPDLQQLYGLLAQYSDDPTQVGLQAAQAMQRQQRMAVEQSPQARMARAIGPLTPGHYTEESLQRFHNAMQETGETRYDLLDRHEALTDRETGMIDDAMKQMYKSQTSMQRASRLANGFMDAARRGQAAGIVQDLMRFGRRVLGSETEADKLFMELDQLANEDIIQNLPPGVASDRDIEIAMRGRPPATANPAYVAAWLNGKVKQNAIKHAYQRFRSTYLSRNKTMAGFPEAWDDARVAITEAALQQAGGLYAPVDANGNPLSEEEALRMRYGEMMGDMLPQIAPGQGATTGEIGPTVRTTTTRQPRSRDELKAKYNLP